MNNWFLEYVKKDYTRESLAYMYVAAIGYILDNEDKISATKQLKRLNQLRENYNEAIELISSKP